jgi:hypothetical protein
LIGVSFACFGCAGSFWWGGGFGGAVEGLVGKAELFDSASVLFGFFGRFFEAADVDVSAVGGFGETIAGIAVAIFVGIAIPLLHVFDDFIENGGDVGLFAPLGEGDEGMLSGVSVVTAIEQPLNVETFFECEVDELLIDERE